MKPVNPNAVYNWIEKIIKYGIYLSVFIPLVIFSEFLSPFHFGKVVIFRSLVQILLVLYLFLLFSPLGRNYLPIRSFVLWAGLLFVAIFGFTTIFSINSYQSFWGNLERMGGFFTFLHYLVFLIILTGTIKTKTEWMRLIKFSVIAGLLSIGYGLLQKTDIGWVIGSGGRVKIFGTIGNPALFAGYVILNTFLALLLYYEANTTRWQKLFYGLAFLLGCLAVFLTGVRGSVLGLIIGLLVLGFTQGSSKLKKITAGSLVVLALIATGLYFFRDANWIRQNSYLERYSDLSIYSRTVQTRFWAWEAGFKGWNDSVKTILVGYGPENFNYPFSFNFNPKFYLGPGSETLFDRAHNMFIEVLVTMGIVGLTAYILLWAAVFRAIKRVNLTKGISAQILTALMIAYLVHSAFIFNTSADFLVFFLILGFIDYLGQTHETKALPKRVPALVPILIGCGFLPVIFLIYFTAVKPARANYLATRAIVAGRARDTYQAIEKFSQALTYETPGQYEIKQRFGQFIIDQANSGDATKDPRIVDALKLAADSFEQSKAEHPADYLPPLFLARIYIMLGKDDPRSSYNDQALENGLTVLEISPGFIRAYFEVAQAYLNKKNYSAAETYFARALELNPEAKISAWYLGMSYIERGDVVAGLKIINESGYDFKTDQWQLLRLIDVYVGLKNYPIVVGLYEDLVKRNPTNPQYYASLAVAYLKIGNKTGAIKAAQAAAQLDPSFQAEADAFIKSLQ